jgi:hypothetical protein
MDLGSSEASSEAFFGGRQVSPQRAVASFARLWAVQIMVDKLPNSVFVLVNENRWKRDTEKDRLNEPGLSFVIPAEKALENRVDFELIVAVETDQLAERHFVTVGNDLFSGRLYLFL